MKRLRLSVDDGCASDLRVAKLAKKYNIETIFYWPVEWHSLAYANGYLPLSYEDANTIASMYEYANTIASMFEIGSHTITHRHLTKLPFEEACYEIEQSKYMLEDMLSVKITKFCFPRGYGNQELFDFTLQLYDSYRLTKGIDSDGYKLVHVHPDSGANDNKPWRECITDKTHLWMHSFDLDRFSLWDELEAVLREQS